MSVLGLFWVLFLCFVRVLFVVFVCVFSGYVDMIWHGATRDAATRRTFVAGRSTSVTLLRATRMMGSSRKPGSGGSGGRAPRGLTVGGTPCPRSTHSLLRVGPDPRPTHFERCSLCHCSLDSPLALLPLTVGGPPRHDPTSRSAVSVSSWKAPLSISFFSETLVSPRADEDGMRSFDGRMLASATVVC